MRSFVNETLIAEKFVIQKLSKYFNRPEEDFDHLSEKNFTSVTDIQLDDKKFDVKFSNPVLINKDKTKRIWDFDMRGKSNYCDFLVLVGIRHNRPDKIFLMKADGAPIHHIRVSITGESKYNEYLIWSIDQ